MAKGKQGVPVTIAGKKRHLKVTMNALLQAEQKGGRNYMIGAVQEAPTLQETLIMAAAALEHEDPEITSTWLANTLTPVEVYGKLSTKWGRDGKGKFVAPEDPDGQEDCLSKRLFMAIKGDFPDPDKDPLAEKSTKDEKTSGSAGTA